MSDKLTNKTPAELIAMAQNVEGRTLETDRLTAIIQTYHQQVGEQPVSMQTRYSHQLQGTDESWQRKSTVEAKWTSLKSWGPWVDSCGLLLIINKEAKHASNPSEEQMEHDAKQTLGLRFGTKGEPQILIRPGRFMALEPFQWQDLQMKCLDTSTKVHVFMVPR